MLRCSTRGGGMAYRQTHEDELIRDEQAELQAKAQVQLREETTEDRRQRALSTLSSCLLLLSVLATRCISPATSCCPSCWPGC